jgi:hypothetical protein
VSEPPLHHDDDGNLVRALPGLVRIAAGAWWRTAGWTVESSVHAGSKLIRAAASGESAAELLAEISSGVRERARDLLGVADVDERIRGALPQSTGRSRADGRDAEATPLQLRDRGAALLEQSADVRFEAEAHPAYARILGELAPDEARILRFLALGGAQPAVDVRTSRTLNVTTEMVAAGLSMIGAEAGCRYLDRVPAYLNNLYRLGLIWFSREPLTDPLRYQVLEAQPDVLAALKSGGRARTVRRSIHLTPFGVDFCEMCLPSSTTEIAVLPSTPEREPHAAPPEGVVGPIEG